MPCATSKPNVTNSRTVNLCRTEITFINTSLGLQFIQAYVPKMSLTFCRSINETWLGRAPYGLFTLPETDSGTESDSDYCPIQK